LTKELTLPFRKSIANIATAAALVAGSTFMGLGFMYNLPGNPTLNLNAGHTSTGGARSK
jgi:hypothetical protein